MVHFQPFSHVKIWFIIQLIANHWEMVGFRVSWEIHSCNPIETSSGRSATRWQISVMRGKSTPKSWFSDIRRESWGCIKPQTCRWWFRNRKQPPRMEINPIDNWDKPTIFNWCKNFVHQQYDDIQGRLLSWSYLRSMSVCGQKASVENDSPPSLLETLRLGGERASWQMPKNRCRELFRTHAAINDWSMMFWCFYPNCIVGYIGYFRLISGMIIRALYRTVTFIFDESAQ